MQTHSPAQSSVLTCADAKPRGRLEKQQSCIRFTQIHFKSQEQDSQRFSGIL